jgi:hydrogenase nickel incorporation protein HypB
MLLNKCDLLPYLRFDVQAAIDCALRVNPRLHVIRVSATSGEGMADWLSWIHAGALSASGTGQSEIERLRQRVADLERQLAAR